MDGEVEEDNFKEDIESKKEDEDKYSDVDIDDNADSSQKIKQLLGSDSDDDDENDEKSTKSKKIENEKDDKMESIEDIDRNDSSSQRDSNLSEINEIIEYPDIPRPPKSSKLLLVKLPSVLRVEDKAYDPHSLEDERGDPETVIRYRYVENTLDQKPESNARFVKWSDGSLQLFIGSEALDVLEQDVSNFNHYVFVKPHIKSALLCQGKMDSQYRFKQGAVKGKIGQAIDKQKRDRAKGKDRKTKLVNALMAPEKEKEKVEKMEEATRRGQRRLEQQRKRKIEKQASAGLNTEFIEDDYDDTEQKIEDTYEDTELKNNRVRDKVAEVEAEKRILEAKSAPAAPVPKAKKPKPTPKEEEDDDIFIEDEPTSVSIDSKKLSSKGKRLVVDDEEE